MLTFLCTVTSVASTTGQLFGETCYFKSSIYAGPNRPTTYSVTKLCKVGFETSFRNSNTKNKMLNSNGVALILRQPSRFRLSYVRYRPFLSLCPAFAKYPILSSLFQTASNNCQGFPVFKLPLRRIDHPYKKYYHI